MTFICRNKIVKFRLQEKSTNILWTNLWLSFETWDSVFDSNDADSMSIFIIHILVFSNKKLNEIKNNAWLTPGIKTLYHHKRDLCFITTNSNEPKLKCDEL